MLLVVEERLGGLGGGGGCGGGTQGEGYDYFMQKGVIQWTYLNTFVPYCRFLKN